MRSILLVVCLASYLTFTCSICDWHALAFSQESNSSLQLPEISGDSAAQADKTATDQAAIVDQAAIELAAIENQTPEEVQAAKQARIKDLLTLVTDNTLYVKPRENPAFYALVKEVLEQSPEQLRGRARENLRFNDLYKNPAEHRGELVHLALNLRRILPIEIKLKNDADVKQLYELWGWTDEAKAWMYCCITPELPPGMPTSGDVAQRIELTGYFFKMQAYQPGDAAPNAKNLVAPLIIGRIVSAPKVDLQAGKEMGNWPIYLIGGFGVIIMLRLMMQLRSFARPTPTHRNYRRRALEAADPEAISQSLGTLESGLKIRNANELP